MKSIKIFLLLFATTILTLSVSAQCTNSTPNIHTNLYYGTGNMVGLDLLVTYPNNIVMGIGGSHATKTFFNTEQRNGRDYHDKNYNVAPWFSVNKNIIESFYENRGTASGLFGYSFNKNKTTIVGDLGVVFKQRINLFTSGDPAQITPQSTNGYQSSALFGMTYGATLTQNIKGRVGLMVGINNVQRFKIGINYRITPTKMFNW